MNLNTFLSSKKTGWLFIVIAIVSRVVNTLFVSFTGRDKIIVVLQSRNFLEGKGLSLTQYFINDIYTPIYDHTPMWPPGYPLLLAPFLKIFDYNIYWATTILDIVVCVLLIFIVRKLCKQVRSPGAAINLMTLIAGCFEYTFTNESLPTDTISLVLLLAGISFLLRFLASPNLIAKELILVSSFLFFGSLFRYNYPANSFTIILILLLLGVIKKDLLLKKKAISLLIIQTVLSVSFFAILKFVTGHSSYITPTETGIFPENIVHWYPVIPASFINIGFLISQVEKMLRTSSWWLTLQILEVINVAAIVILIVIFLRLFLKKSFYNELDPFKWFLLLGFSISVSTFGVLGYMSLTHQMLSVFGSGWNYIYEARYFAFIYIFFQICFISWIYFYKPFSRSLFLKFIAGALSFLLLLEVGHNIYFHIKVTADFKKYKSNVFREKDYKLFAALLNDVEKKYTGYDIWTAAPTDEFSIYYTSYYGHKGIKDANNMTKSFPLVKRKTILLFVLHDLEISAYSSFLAEKKALLLGSTNNINFYKIELSQ